MTTATLDQTTASIEDLAMRNSDIVARAEAGEDLTSIGATYGLSRERARQIVEKFSLKSNAEIREARRARRAQERDLRANDRAQEIRAAASEHPKATLSMLAEITGHSLSDVKEALDWSERERRTDVQVYPSVSDEAIFAVIRRVAALPGGEPLTGSFYDEHRDGGVSHARLLQRFGTWTAACKAAGVVPRAANPGRVYTRNWTTDVMVDWVWAYLSNSESPTYAKFEKWLRDQSGAPSAQTIRNSLGSWVEMKRAAIEKSMPSEAPVGNINDSQGVGTIAC